MNEKIRYTCLPHSATSVRLLLLPALIAGCTAPPDSRAGRPPQRPLDPPALHHVLLNSVDPEAAIEWYLEVWSSAERTEFAGFPAVASEMYLLFNEVDVPAPGAHLPALGRPEAQSAFWHIGAFANTTDMDEELAAIGVSHLPLFTGPDDTQGVWRSGLAPYTGTLTAEELSSAGPVLPRPGGFSYVLAPDGVLFELTGGANTTASMSHVHLFHEHPQCAANWYVEHLGMSLPPIRREDGSASERPPPTSRARRSSAKPGGVRSAHATNRPCRLTDPLCQPPLALSRSTLGGHMRSRIWLGLLGVALTASPTNGEAQHSERINPLIELQEQGRPVFGLYAPANRGGRLGAPPAAPRAALSTVGEFRLTIGMRPSDMSVRPGPRPTAPGPNESSRPSAYANRGW